MNMKDATITIGVLLFAVVGLTKMGANSPSEAAVDHALPPHGPPLDIGVAAPMESLNRFSGSASRVMVPTDTDADIEAGGDTAPLPSAEYTGWVPDPDSPLALLDSVWWARYEPTFENVLAWTQKLEDYKDLSDAQVQAAFEVPGFLDAWTESREHLALRRFIIDYEGREYRRWLEGSGSIPLEVELKPAADFVEQLPDPSDIWASIGLYSDQVVTQLQTSGDTFETSDHSKLKWEINAHLTAFSKTSVELLTQTLNQQ